MGDKSEPREEREETLVEALCRLRGKTPPKRIEGKHESARVPSEPSERPRTNQR
jgi:hypothetical protein